MCDQEITMGWEQASVVLTVQYSHATGFCSYCSLWTRPSLKMSHRKMSMLNKIQIFKKRGMMGDIGALHRTLPTEGDDLR